MESYGNDPNWNKRCHTSLSPKDFDSCKALALVVDDKVLGIMPRPTNIFLMNFHYPDYWYMPIKYAGAKVIPVNEDKFESMFNQFIDYLMRASIKHKAKIMNEMMMIGLPIKL